MGTLDAGPVVAIVSCHRCHGRIEPASLRETFRLSSAEAHVRPCVTAPDARIASNPGGKAVEVNEEVDLSHDGSRMASHLVLTLALALAGTGCLSAGDDDDGSFPTATSGLAHLQSAIEANEVGAFGSGRSTRYHQLRPGASATTIGIVLSNIAIADPPLLFFGQPTATTRTASTAYAQSNGGLGFQTTHAANAYFHDTFPLQGLDVTKAVTVALNLPSSQSSFGASYELWMFFDGVEADRFEPNEDSASATTLRRDPDFQGVVYEANGTITPGDIDVLSFTIGTDDDIDATLTFPHDIGNLTIELLNAQGVSGGGVQNTSSSTRPTERVLFGAANLQGGTYFLRVKGASAADAAGYHLQVDTQL